MVADRKLVATILMLVALLVFDNRTGDPAPARHIAPPQTPKPQLPPYEDVIYSMASARQQLKDSYQGAASPTKQRKALGLARKRLYTGIHNDLLPQWLGTAWGFNGTTQVPRSGKIACGYFVTTILRDAGFNLERARLAQQPSELIIKSLITEAHIKRYSNEPIKEFIQSVRDWGQGLYVVGLDIHTGFILHDAEGVFFTHSSYEAPKKVIHEDALESPILSSSKYRVLGKLSADDALLIKWLEEQSIATRTQ